MVKISPKKEEDENGKAHCSHTVGHEQALHDGVRGRFRGSRGGVPRRCTGDGIRHGRKTESRYHAGVLGRRVDHPGGPHRTGCADRCNHHHPEGHRLHSPVRLAVKRAIARTRESATLVRHARIIFILACFFIVLVPSSAQAINPSPDTPFEDMNAWTKLAEDGDYPGTLGWELLDQTEKDQALRAFVETENLYDMYSGSVGPGLEEWASHFTTAEAQEAADLYGELRTAASGIADGGATDIALGAESLDLTSALGIITGPATLVPLVGWLATEDIFTGTNFLTQKFFSSEEDYKGWQSEISSTTGDQAAEKMQWVKIKESAALRTAERGATIASQAKWTAYWSSSFLEYEALCPSGVRYLESNVEKCSASEAKLQITGSPKVSKLSPNTYGGNCFEPGVKLPENYQEYIMVGEVSGELFTSDCSGSVEARSKGIAFGSAGLKNWISQYALCASKGGNAERTKSIAGWPVKIGPYAAIADTTLYCQAGFAFVGNIAENTIFRSPSRMHIGLPRTKTSTEVNKLKEEGHDLGSHTITPITNKSQLVPALKKMAEKMGEGGSRRLENWWCHYLNCETTAKSAKPETTTKEAEPAKAEGVPPAIPGTAEVPNCFLTEQSATTCKSTLESSGFTKVEIDVVTWQHAVVTKPADAVISVEPAAGSIVETTTKLIVDANPKTSEMPVAIPFIQYGTETGTQYKERLEREGWTKVSVQTLTETATDPSIGPNDASYTVPSEGSETAPGKATPITVEQNPSDAPSPSEGGGITPPILPGFKIPNFGVLCKGFPFGVPCWLIKTVESWSATSKCPVWSIGEYTVHGKKIPEASINLCSYGLEPIMEKARIAMLIFSTLGLVLLFYRFAKGGSPGSGGSQDLGYSFSSVGEEQGGHEGF